MKALWGGWVELLTYVGDFQSRLVLTVFYFVVLPPFALLLRLSRRSPRRRRPPGWSQRPVLPPTIEAVRRQS